MNKVIKRPDFKFFAVNGMEKTEIAADSIELHVDGYKHLELHPRRSDGDITLYADGCLVVRPEAANCARVSSEKRR